MSHRASVTSDCPHSDEWGSTMAREPRPVRAGAVTQENNSMRLKLALAACTGAIMLLPAMRAAVNSPVADAAMKGDRTTLTALLAQKADVNAQQADGATALQWAAYRNDLSLADELIAAGANVKLANRNGV